MKTERLIQSGILNNGEPRHYASWEIPQLPKLNTARVGYSGGFGEAMYRRQRASSVKNTRGLVGLLQSFSLLRRS